MPESMRNFIPVNIAVLTVSDSRTQKTDKSGPLLVQLATDSGHQVIKTAIVKDEIDQIQSTVKTWVNALDINVVLTTGGTGVTGRDGTPEAITPLLDKQIPGFGEMFRFLSYQKIGTSTLQSRALAGVANGTYVFVLPGSSGACKDAWEMLIEKQLDYRTLPCNLVELMPRLLET